MARVEREWQAEQEGAALATEVHRVLVVSHRQAKGFIDGRCVTVNGTTAETYGIRLKTGDRVKVSFDPERTYEVLPPPKKLQSGPFETLWEDAHLLFVHKPAGLLTVPAEQGGEPSLAEAITESYRRRGFKRFQLYIVHRLDRFTSGVLVFAKTPEALHGLKKLFELHKLQRVYHAVLVGELPENSGTLTGHLIEHAKSLKMSVAKERKGSGGRRMPPGAKEAVTHYRVVERLPGHTVVEVKLETGRRNQIRVQFADRGYPLLGDQVYGTESPLLDRQALHAELLGFRHPITEEQVTVTAPMPADLEAALKALRTQARLHRAVEGVKGEEGIFKPRITRERKLDRASRARRFDRPDAPSEPSSRPHREASEPRPRRTFDPKDRPARPRSEGPSDRPRREASEPRPRRTFDPKDRPARPRSEGPSDRPRREASEPRPRRTFDPKDRPARPRSEGPSDRPRREASEPRPRRTFDPKDRPARPRSEGPSDRPRREASEPRPRRTFDPKDRPARPRSEGPSDRPRREASEPRPRRTFDPKDRPARPRSEGPSDRPRREASEPRPRRTFDPKDRPARPRSEGPSDRPHREGPKKAAIPRTGKPKPRKF